MLPYGYYEAAGAPLSGRMLEKVKALLRSLELEYEEGSEFTAAILDPEDRVVATGSLQGNVLKCIGVAPDHRESGLTLSLLTSLLDESRRRGWDSVFLYTKPENQTRFEGAGFSRIAQSSGAILMERPPGGLSEFLRAIPRPPAAGVVGAVVVNCNPMTNGHLYLVDTARRACDFLYVFVLSEDQSAIPAADRLRLVREVLAGRPGVAVCGTSRYLISSATFPTYFLREAGRPQRAWCQLDIDLFGRRIAPALGITRRFVGSEPYCQLTRDYNRQLQERLPAYGVQVTEFPRACLEGRAVSASLARGLAALGRFDLLRPLVPPAVYQYLVQQSGRLFPQERAEKPLNDAQEMSR